MIVCKVGDPIVVDGWHHIVEIEPCAALPLGRITPERPGWPESWLERSFLKRPEVLARALGVRTPLSEIHALRQVARIDLYLRAGKDLHLLEVKKPTEHTKWRFAAEEVTRQWCSAAIWLRRGVDSVHLWAVTPVRWSRSKGKPKVPRDWHATLRDIAREKLTHVAAAELSILFYVIVRSRSGRFVVLWRADEPVPALTV